MRFPSTTPPPRPADKLAPTEVSPPAAQLSSVSDALATPLSLWKAGHKERAEALSEDILTGRLQAEAHLVKSFFAEATGNLEAALEHAIGAGSQAAPIHVPSLLYRLGRFDEALAAAEETVTTQPKSGPALCQFALFLREAGRLSEARDKFQRAIALAPDLVEAHFGLGQILLLQGEYRAGWDEYEWRFRLPMATNALPKLPQPFWNGMKWPEGRLVLIADQGYGDSIQFVRFLPLAAERIGTVILGCNTLLRPLFESLPGNFKIIERLQDIPEVDVQLPLSGLPRLLEISEQNISNHVPYLTPSSEAIERWCIKIDALNPSGALKVGLCWAGRPTHPNDAKRTMLFELFAPLAKIEGVQFFGVQHGPLAEQGKAWGDMLHDLSPGFHDFSEAAAAIANLDLVISVDTVTIHLAGAIGKPAWVMISAIPDWRWLLDREDTSWYPSLRLFRQDEDRLWEPVISRVAEELAALAKSRRTADQA